VKKDEWDTVIMPRSIDVKPLLTDVHKMQRVLFASLKLTEPNQFHCSLIHDFKNEISNILLHVVLD
jgi:hypothetical protein